jgi:hypothetical protein
MKERALPERSTIYTAEKRSRLNRQFADIILDTDPAKRLTTRTRNSSLRTTVCRWIRQPVSSGFRFRRRPLAQQRLLCPWLAALVIAVSHVNARDRKFGHVDMNAFYASVEHPTSPIRDCCFIRPQYDQLLVAVPRVVINCRRRRSFIHLRSRKRRKHGPSTGSNCLPA